MGRMAFMAWVALCRNPKRAWGIPGFSCFTAQYQSNLRDGPKFPLCVRPLPVPWAVSGKSEASSLGAAGNGDPLAGPSPEHGRGYIWARATNSQKSDGNRSILGNPDARIRAIRISGRHARDVRASP